MESVTNVDDTCVAVLIIVYSISEFYFDSVWHYRVLMLATRNAALVENHGGWYKMIVVTV